MRKKFFSVETYDNQTGEIAVITTSQQLEGVETFDDIQDYCIKVANEKQCKGAVRDEFGQRVLCFNYSEHCDNNICFSWSDDCLLDEFIQKHPVEKTPTQIKFEELKAANPDALVLFARGDFFEAYQEDAVAAAKILGITLTYRNSRGHHAEPGDEMAGFPRHALEGYLAKLMRAGKTVIISEEKKLSFT